MKSEDYFLIFAIIVAIVSVVAFGMTFASISTYKETWLTGYVAANGTVNLTILSSAAINFTTDSINWGAGRVNTGSPNATLITIPQINNSGGNWSNVTSGFIIENIGNVNVTLWIATQQNATTMINGTNPRYHFNVTNVETGSCINRTGFNLGQWYDVNRTNTGVGNEGTYVCSNFSYADSSDRIRIDLRLVIPSDSATGVLGDIMSANAYQSA